MLSFSKKEKVFLQSLDTPKKAQDYLDSLRFNFEKGGETVKSPIRTMRGGNAHCLEGALLGAYILSLHGFPPLLLHLKTTKDDFDHVIAPFKVRGLWGALSKTNHSVLRYREPVHRSIRELVMTYFHEYFTDDGKISLRKYSRPLSMNVFEAGWEREDGDLWGVDEELDRIKHYDVAPKDALKNMRPADKIVRLAGEKQEYRPL
jgi:hypothetical protein